MGINFSAKLALTKRILGQKIVKILLAIWAVICTYDTALSQIIPESLGQRFPKVREVIAMTSGFLPVWGWLLILAAIIVVASLEYAYRQINAANPPERASSAKGENTKGAIIRHSTLPTKRDETIVVQSDNDQALSWDWEKLFVIDGNSKTIKLRFLPDTDAKNRRKDAPLLVLLGYEVIFGFKDIRSSKLNEEIKRAYRECPNIPNAALSVLMGLATVLDDTDYGMALIGCGEAERNRLSDGGSLELTMDGNRRARALAWEAIRRA